MLAIRTNVESADTAPKGKRGIRRSQAGNLIGYIGGKRWEIINGLGIEPFSNAESKAADAWLAGRADWQLAAWE